MRSEELASPHRRGARLDFFNVDEQGARALIHDHSPFSARRQGSGAPSVLVVGLSRLGQSLVAELARQSRIQPAATEHPIQITVIDPNATEIVEGLRRRHPLLAHRTRLVIIEATLDPLDIDAIEPGVASTRMCAWEVLLVPCRLRCRSNIACPTQTRGRRRTCSRQRHGRVIDRPEGSRRIWAFNVLERTMRCDVLLGGTYELLASAIHDEYLGSQHQEGSTAATNPSLQPWEELPESLKESNRDQAAHIGTKLAAVGRGVVPLADWTPTGTLAFHTMKSSCWRRWNTNDGSNNADSTVGLPGPRTSWPNTRPTSCPGAPSARKSRMRSPSRARYSVVPRPRRLSDHLVIRLTSLRREVDHG